MVKLTVPLMVAYFLCNRPLPPGLGQLSVSVVLVAVPTLLVAKQPDLGTALLIASSGAFVLFLAGLRWMLITIFVVLIASSAPVFWYAMHDYQRQRVLTLLNPEQDPLGTGYHIMQSKIAIGSGGLYGKGC